MKNTMKCFRAAAWTRILNLIALAVIGFSFAACSNGTTGNGGGDTHNAKTYTYTGTVDGVMYTLKIDGCTCAGLTPKIGDNYTLTVGGKTSTGAVTSFKLWVLILEPFNATTTFTVTVSGISITAMSGTITWSDDTTALAPTGPWVIGPVHTHTYSSAWSYNETQHWHECTANDGATTDVADHTFLLGPICSVCYYIMGSDGTGSGTETNPIPLTVNVWADGSITSGVSAVWYSFNVTSGTIYYVWWNDYFDGDDTKTADVVVSAYYSNGTSIFTNEDDGWDNPQFFLASTSGTVKIKVELYHDTSHTGTFAVAYSATNTRPGSNPNSAGPTNWTPILQHPFGTSELNLNAVAYGDNTWVAGGASGRLAYSEDNGVTWTAVEDSTFGTSSGESSLIRGIAYGNNTFVAVGGYYNSGKMAYSTDNGVTWSAVANTAFGTTYNQINAIAYGNGTFVAVGSYGNMAYSLDNGVTWTAVADSKFGAGQNGITTITYGNGRFVAVGGDANIGKIAYSYDGINWTPVSDPALDQISGIAYGGGRFVALGSSKGNGDGDTAYSTDNGVTWTAVRREALGATNSGIGYGNGIFLGANIGGVLAYSPDGVSWTRVINIAAPFGYISENGIAYGNGRFVVVGRRGMAYCDW